MKKIIASLTLFLLTTVVCLAVKPNRKISNVIKSTKIVKKACMSIEYNSCGYVTGVCNDLRCTPISPPPPSTCESPYPPTGPESVPTDGPGRG